MLLQCTQDCKQTRPVSRTRTRTSSAKCLVATFLCVGGLSISTANAIPSQALGFQAANAAISVDEAVRHALDQLLNQLRCMPPPKLRRVADMFSELIACQSGKAIPTNLSAEDMSAILQNVDFLESALLENPSLLDEPLYSDSLDVLFEIRAKVLAGMNTGGS